MVRKPIAKVSAAMAIAAMLAGTAFVSATSVSAAPDKQKSAAGDPSRRVCRTVVPSGSRLTSRVCRTQAEWDEARTKTQEGLLRTQTNESTLLEQSILLAPVGGSTPR